MLSGPAMSGTHQDQLTEEIVTRVMHKLGPNNAEATRIVAQEVAAVLAASPNALDGPRERTAPRPERIVVTANGKNRPGIVVRLATAIDEFRGDIRDISQTIVGEYFSMIIVVDITGATSQGSRFGELRHRLKQIGEELGVHVVAIHDDILTTMHTV